jgi:uncharacterized protein YfbU (UPF0304 family)
MKITIRIEKNYGIETAYPACQQSKLLAKLAGTKTLTHHALETIAALGYSIQIEQLTPRTFAHLAGA